MLGRNLVEARKRLVSDRKLRIAVLGTRGIPDVMGGVETHCQALYPRLVAKGHSVTIFARKGYVQQKCPYDFQGVRVIPIWAAKRKSLEAICHTIWGILQIVRHRSSFDLLHIHAIGPALLVPVARLLGIPVVMTHHGPDYDRQKWGRLAKLALRLGERFGMLWSNGRIVISEVIREIVRQQYGRQSTLIPNGVVLPELPSSTATLKKFDLLPGKYILLVSRLVPEKRHLDLIAAFLAARLPDWKLVIVGASDHPDAYTRQVLDVANATPGVVCTGFQSGLPLSELYAHAGMFVLPSSHEGLPIAMLEALSYGLPVLASDIPANVEVGLLDEHYFPLGDVTALTDQLRIFAARPLLSEEREARRSWVMSRYDWSDIAERTLDVYREFVEKYSKIRS